MHRTNPDKEKSKDIPPEPKNNKNRKKIYPCNSMGSIFPKKIERRIILLNKIHRRLHKTNTRMKADCQSNSY
jgi:hypothetical protein